MNIKIKESPNWMEIYKDGVMVYAGHKTPYGIGADGTLRVLGIQFEHERIGEIYDDGFNHENLSIIKRIANKTDKIFLKSVKLHAYCRENCKDPLITGFCRVKIDACQYVYCFEVTYEDGFVFKVPISYVNNGTYWYTTE